jgi:HlyD family secretion protein
MTVELAKVSRTSIREQITVVGNLIGEATVSVAPRAAGRLETITVKMGDRVSRGQRIATIEDYEIREQVKQAEAAQEVSLATIRQREADLRRAETNVDRSRSLFQRQLLPRQTLDDNEATYQSAVAQVDLARAQNNQSKARLDELRINLANTIISSPVNGFIAKRAVDPGASVSQNVPVVDVVDITRVRLVANVVEKDLRQLASGDTATVEVDAYPGEKFTGRIARLAPVLDPATRTAPIEIEIPNPDFRLKPGMYARVGIVTDTKKDALVAPSEAVIDLGGRRGVFLPQNNLAIFRPVQVGNEQSDVVEILAGINEGEMVITTGAAALRDGDRILLPGGARGGDGNGRRGRGGQTAEQGAAPGGAAANRNLGATATDGSARGVPEAGNGGGRRFGQGQGQGQGQSQGQGQDSEAARRFGGGRRGQQGNTPRPPGGGS